MVKKPLRITLSSCLLLPGAMAATPGTAFAAGEVKTIEVFSELPDVNDDGLPSRDPGTGESQAGDSSDDLPSSDVGADEGQAGFSLTFELPRTSTADFVEATSDAATALGGSVQYIGKKTSSILWSETTASGTTPDDVGSGSVP
jgi:hypothetical protein